MTHSYRHTPICGHGEAKPGSEKWFKRRGNRRWRRMTRDALYHGRWDAMPVQREASNPWDWPKDGKFWFADSEWCVKEWRK